MHVIPNGADRKRFRPANAFTRARLRTALGLPLQARVVVFAARFDGMKNIPLFLESTRELLLRDPATAVVACGAGMSRANPALNALIREIFGTDRALLSRLRLLGVRQDMENVYRAADVVALTSSVGEAAPLCLIEGMLCGAVPVATDVGDCASIVEGRGLTAPADPVALAAAWIEAFDLRERLLADLPGVAEQFSQRRMVSAYAEMFNRLRKSVALRPRTLTPA
jgi:glycosyltransferase involved in cell wall biosynthesis